MENKRKRILFYESSSGFGGSAYALVNLIKYLNREQFIPILIIKNYGTQFKRIKNTEIEIIKLKAHNRPEEKSYFSYAIYFIKNIIPEAIKFYFIIKRKKISYLHTNTNIMDNIPAIIASKLAGIRCICHFRGMRKLFKMEKFFIDWIDRLIVLNKNAYEYFSQIIKKEKISLIYDGIHLGDFNNVKTGLFRKEFNFNASSIIGVIGRIVKGKGQKEFILTVKEVLKLKPETKFVIVGDAKGGNDTYYKEVKTLVKIENLEKNIIFTGWREDIKNIISDLDILVFTSTTFPEGLPNIIIEAMALEKPVVSTNIPGPPEIIIEGETGFLVPPGDIKAMAEKIIYLLDNPRITKRMGEEGRKRVEGYFNMERNIQEIQRVFDEISISEKRIKNINIYKIFKLCLSHILYYSGLSIIIMQYLLYRKRECFIFMYHRINKNKNSIFNGVPKEFFERQIKFIKRFFNIVDFKTLLNSPNNKAFNRKLAIITFDDGYKSTYDYAFPVLSKYHLPATVFLTTSILGNGKLLWTDAISYAIDKTIQPELSIRVNGTYRKFNLLTQDRDKVTEEIKEILKNIDNTQRLESLKYLLGQLDINFEDIPESEKMLNWTEVLEMSKEKIEFGSHTANHPILSRVNLSEAEKEIVDSRLKIESTVGKPVTTFCYPNGRWEDFNDNIKEILRKMGFESAVTSIEGTVKNNDDYFALKRISLSNRHPALITFKIIRELLKNA